MCTEGGLILVAMTAISFIFKSILNNAVTLYKILKKLRSVHFICKLIKLNFHRTCQWRSKFSAWISLLSRLK